jgi:putative ABC transport system substrate-binding protein
LPAAGRFALLVDPRNRNIAESVTADAKTAVSTIGRQIEVFSATNAREIDSVFERLVQRRTEALLVSPQLLFVDRRVQIVTLASRRGVPAIYFERQFADAGGLMSYGTNITYHYAQAGIYTGRILKGEKPSDLPVMRPTRFEFVINLQTARTLGIEVPATLLALADEVIE